MARKSNFDRDEKLVQAMELFWQKGYANTAISDLIDSLQINRFSLYNSFGDKQNLYYEALEKYLSSVSIPTLSSLENQDASLEELEQFLKQFAQMQRLNNRGCFMQNALVEHAGTDDTVLQKGHFLFDHLIEIFSRAISNAQRQSKLRVSHEPRGLAQLVLTQMQGMRVLGKAKRNEDLEMALTTLLMLIKA
ncbi:TetR/AcrR family transcriptional regulator [Vibrio plantisponsor]|uniref:TetR/AcrR family transcriptional regulator n=1 Tax=Vibrio plantisponsor TaxID=664643 RepID=A0ABU4IPD4_9VIBR|nr:TetR/AcrR family transcriptional regulator [Vibrio plantisponsor]MDW6020108.1 TetR/AcrR family transcriptional regulator [Vibrio plantisponsor]NNM40941.1 TetR/AcrR family transcriptional regulator [Vibrio plantisponsor]